MSRNLSISIRNVGTLAQGRCLLLQPSLAGLLDSLYESFSTLPIRVQLPFSPSLAFFGFFFFLLRSLFFIFSIPFLHTSAYLKKKPSISSGLTTVLSLIFLPSSLPSFDSPFDARTRMGSGFAGFRSQRGSSGIFCEESEDVGMSYVRRFWIRLTEPGCFFACWVLKRAVSWVKNYGRFS